MTPNWVRASRLEALSLEPPEQSDQDVLLIEEDADIADMYAFGLKMSGYPVTVTESLDDGLPRLGDPGWKPKVIVLDVELPPERGFDLLSALRHSPDTMDVPVIVLVNDNEDYSEAYRLGATDCHARHQTTPKQLVGYVTAALREGRARKQTS
jgi:DNA-binding response OmpR family regulator